MGNVLNKKKNIKIIVEVLNDPSHDTLLNTARILKTLGTSA
ncbi:hypothetical protein [Rossellomorea marisflavi]|nr:hypothetical protein [Rossellomorea marisflavi]